jgi:hypothetical protein
MRSLFRLFLLCASLAVCVPALAEGPGEAKPDQSAAQCEHGVKKSICARCNPKLEPVFKSKGDWCAEHKRPESQCAICNPELKKRGVKP